MNHFYFEVSFGTILVSWNVQGLLNRIDWSPYQSGYSLPVSIPIALENLIDRLRAYFDEGKPIGLIPWNLLDQTGWTDFQKRVYHAVTEIPHGETRTYGWVAKRLGNKAACRAVGQSLKKNPLPILIPCHRIQSVNSMGGFMGAVDPAEPELQLKKRLLELEEEYQSPVFSFVRSTVGWTAYSQALRS